MGAKLQRVRRGRARQGLRHVVLGLERLEPRAMLDGTSVTVELDPALDQFGDQIPTVQAIAARPGTLSWRDQDRDDVGSLTFSSDPGITNAGTVDLYWEGGRRVDMTVTGFGGTAITVSGGAGDVLPAEGTPVVCDPPTLGDSSFADFGIFDTGASVVTFSGEYQMWAGALGDPIPIKVPGGASAEGIGGWIEGDVSQPGTIFADGMRAMSLTFDEDGFPDFRINPGATGAATRGIQTFVGTDDSPDLVTITGTPFLNASPEHPEGLSALVDMRGYLMDFSGLPGLEGLTFAMPDIRFASPGTPPSTIAGQTTDPVYVALDFFGFDNHLDPGHSITESYNPVQSEVTVSKAWEDDRGTRTIGGQNFLFDTGAQLSVISTQLAMDLGFNLGRPETQIDVSGVGGTVQVKGYTLSELTLPTTEGGTVRFTHVPVYVLDIGYGINGILGMNLFNTAHSMVYDPFHPTGNPDDPTAPMLGLTFYPNGDRGEGDLDPGTIATLQAMGLTFFGGSLLPGFQVESAADTTPPTADILPIAPDPRNTPVDTVRVVFSEGVRGVDIGDFRLTRNGTPVSLEGLSVTEVTPLTYTLDLSSVTTLEGAYVLTLAAAGSGIEDGVGNLLADDATDTWITDTTPPTADIHPIVPDPRNTPVDTLTVVFSEPVDGVDIGDFGLTRNGTPVSLASSSVAKVTADTYTLDLSSVTTLDGAYVLTLTATDSGIKDIAGDPLEGDATVAWTIDTVPPTPPTGLAISPDTGESPTDGITNTGALVLSGAVEERGLAVSVWDDTVEIVRPTATPGPFRLPLDLPDGQHPLRVVVTDAAGNFSQSLFNVVVDRTPPPAPVITGIEEDTGASAGDYLTSDRSPTFLGTAEPGAHLEVRLDGGALSSTLVDAMGNWNQGYTNLAPGTHKFEARAVDAAGNVSDLASLTVVIDTTPPVTTLTLPADGAVYNAVGWKDIAGTASDTGGAGLWKVWVSVQQGVTGLYWNGAAFASPGEVSILATGTDDWLLPFPAINFATDGEYIVRARATDQAGNEESTAKASFRYDTTAPQAAMVGWQVTPGSDTQIDVHYQPADVNQTTLDSQDIRITGSGGFSQVARQVIVDRNPDGTLEAHYSIAGPGGSWDAADNGTYQVWMEPNQVADLAGNPVAAGLLGSFPVAIPGTQLSVSMQGPSKLIAGQAATYTVTVANAGPDAAANVRLADVLPDGTTFAWATVNRGGGALATPASGSAGGTVVWTMPTLAAGRSAVLTLVVITDGSSEIDNRAIVNQASVTTDTPNTAASTAATATTTLRLVGIATQTNPLDPRRRERDLIVGLGNGKDVVEVRQTSAGLKVTVNGVESGPYRVDGRLLVFGRGGADRLTVKSSDVRAWLFGGSGGDVLAADAVAASVLCGGVGDDMLSVARGRNLLIGGVGKDRLTTTTGGSILVGGMADVEANQVALDALLDEWTVRYSSHDGYLTRLRHIQGTLGGGLNGPWRLNADTVYDDGIADTLQRLKRGSGWNWYLARRTLRPVDAIIGAVAGEVISPI